MKPLLVFLAVASLWAGTEARAQFNTYSEWEAQSPTYRSAYVAGALDFYWILAKSVGSPTQVSRAKALYECVTDAKITNVQISENLRSFVSARPSLQSGTVVGALISYIEELCGDGTDALP